MKGEPYFAPQTGAPLPTAPAPGTPFQGKIGRWLRHLTDDQVLALAGHIEAAIIGGTDAHDRAERVRQAILHFAQRQPRRAV